MSKKKLTKKPKDENVEEIFEKEITFMCPVRGKVTEKVKIKKIKPKITELSITAIESSDDLLSKLDKNEEGLELEDE